MEDAGIHEFNLVEYTSMLPPEAEEVSMDNAKQAGLFHHGAVLECIMSEVHGSRGNRITAGVGRVMVRSKGRKGLISRDKGGRVGGFATEYKGHAAADMAEKQLSDALDELFDRRFGPKDHEMEDKEYEIKSEVVGKAFGTVMSGVCFVDFIFPVIEDCPGSGTCRNGPADASGLTSGGELLTDSDLVNSAKDGSLLTD